MDELQRTLGNAGVNLAMIRFGGSMSCMVSRSDVNTNPEDGLRQWIAEHQGKRTNRARPATRPIHAADSAENATVASPKTPDHSKPADESQRVQVTTLREMLVEDLSRRLSLPVDSVQMRFNPEDRSTLDLSTPQFQFNIEPVRVYNLGDVIWNVTIIAGDSSKKVQIKAQAFAWRQQVVAVRPLSYRQMIRDEDVVSRRTLVNHLSDEPLLSLDQVVGQQAARQLKPGALFTASMVDAAPLVRMGQLVTVILARGGIEIKTVGRAMENGAYGQTIRVRNERTRDVYQAVVSGQQTVRLGGMKATDQG
jgi:flagella basal body P-ring formation protein FlgA